MPSSVSTEEEWLSSIANARECAEKGPTVESPQYPNPTHPVQQLQGPFDESIFESAQKLDQEQLPELDCYTRRKLLLENSTYERTCSGKWAQRSGEKYHPLWKLVAQLSFGMHLLVKGLAKSELEVMKILQSHVDEIDGFLGRTTEDLDLGDSDIRERIRLLRVPLEHQRVFDSMLEERSFRSLIIEGNDKIEHVIERSALSMHDTLKDIQKGLDAIGALGRYLEHIGKSWTRRPRNLDAVFHAMVGNVEGWEHALLSLQTRGNGLGVSLIQLGAAASEMQRRVGIASRKNVTSIPPSQNDVSALQSPRNNSSTIKPFRPASTSRQLIDLKPLPEAPNPRDSIHEALSKPHLARQSTPNIQSTVQKVNPTGHHRHARYPPQAGIITRPQSMSGPPGHVEFPKAKPKAVAWEITIPEERPNRPTIEHRPSSAPSERHHLRSRSHGHGESELNGKSTTLKGILDSFLQSERKKPLSYSGNPDDPPRKLTNQRSLNKLKISFPVFGQTTGDSRPRRQSVSVFDARQSALNLFRARSSDDLRNFMSPGPSNRATPVGSPPIPKSEQHFMWSDSGANVSSTYILKPSSGSSSPRLPQPVDPYCASTRESIPEDKEDKTDAESIITALPSIGSLTPRTVEERTFGGVSGSNSPRPIPTIQEVTPPRRSSRHATSSRRATPSNSGTRRTGRPSSKSIPSGHSHARKSSLPLRDSNSKVNAPLPMTPDDRSRNRKNSSLRIRVTDSTKPRFGPSLHPASLVEYLASTPPASPIHARNPPAAGGDDPRFPAIANKLSQSHSSRSRLGLGVKIGFDVNPDMGSPPPPGPGGPVMVTPDYGAQSAFDGEKTARSRRTISVGQIFSTPEKSLRRFFGSFVGDSTRNGAAESGSSGRKSQSSSKDRVPVGQGFRRDVNCFHGVGKDGTWVTSDRSR
ncbi:hypothetical protein FQN54_000986 [Arachnomyces sp. PD_36]|nr:hypothetical protein FQN54_000986 [Arachnomyces sp. PD_36]